MTGLTGYQTCYAAAFAQAFNYWMQTRGFAPMGPPPPGYAASTADLETARNYAEAQAKLAADQYWKTIEATGGS